MDEDEDDEEPCTDGETPGRKSAMIPSGGLTRSDESRRRV